MFQIDNEFKNATVQTTVRFTDALFYRLGETATANGISFNLLVLQCCKYALDNMDNNKPTDSPKTVTDE